MKTKDMQMRRSMLSWVMVIALALLVVTVSVAQTPSGEAAPAPSAQPAAAPTAAAPAADPAEVARRAQVIASFNGGAITVGSLEDEIKAQNPFMQMRYLDPAALKDLYDRTLRFELLAQEAARRGVDKRPDVNEAIKQNAVQTLYRKDFDEVITPESITPEEVKAYYDAHQEEFNRPAMRRASHIVVATREEALALLPDAKKADVGEFRRLAREKSIDQTNKARGGDLRYFDKDGHPRGEPGASVPAAVVKAVFALKTVGDVSAQPIAIDGGFSIVKYTGERPAESRTLAQADESIRARLWRTKRAEAMDAFVASIRARLKPEIHPELVDAIRFEDISPTAGIAPGFPVGKGPGQVGTAVTAQPAAPAEQH